MDKSVTYGQKSFYNIGPCKKRTRGVRNEEKSFITLTLDRPGEKPRPRRADCSRAHRQSGKGDVLRHEGRLFARQFV
jgi:hypothetical protein